ncbi:MAG: acyl-CoA thioesterase [Puniceicoccaceae bacterium]
MIRAEARIRVRYAETDAMGFVHHGRFIPWFECARIEMLDGLGCPYRELEEAEGIRIPVLEVRCRYRAPARFDDRIRVAAEIRDFPRARFRVHYEVRREDGALLCEAETLHAFIDRAERACRPPLRLREAFARAFEDGA